MDIRGQRRSSNIEDRRGMSPVRKGVGLSLGGILFLIVLSFFGINPLPFLGVATKAGAGGDAAVVAALPGVGGRSAAQRTCGRDAGADRRNLGQAVRWQVPAADHGDVQRPDAIGVRHRSGRDGAVLLPARPEGLPRPLVLPGTRAEVRRARRLRPGLRDCPRSRSSRAEPDGHRREGAEARSSAPAARPRPTSTP